MYVRVCIAFIKRDTRVPTKFKVATLRHNDSEGPGVNIHVLFAIQCMFSLKINTFYIHVCTSMFIIL